MKTMKILILHRFFNDFGENPAAVSNQPGARQATSGPRETARQREPFAVAFGKNMKISILHMFFHDFGEKSTHSKFGGWVILLVLQWVFNDFTY